MIEAFRRTPYDREILRIGLPALGALAADPLVSLIDTAFVGRLGATALASVAIASMASSKSPSASSIPSIATMLSSRMRVFRVRSERLLISSTKSCSL